MTFVGEGDGAAASESRERGRKERRLAAMSAMDFGAVRAGRLGASGLSLAGCGLASGEVWAVETEPSGGSVEEAPE